jgi:hypothetical protein
MLKEGDDLVGLVLAMKHADTMVRSLASGFALSLNARRWEADVLLQDADALTTVADDGSASLRAAITITARAEFSFGVSLSFIVSLRNNGTAWLVSSIAQLLSDDIVLDDLDLFLWNSPILTAESLVEVAKNIRLDGAYTEMPSWTINSG